MMLLEKNPTQNDSTPHRAAMPPRLGLDGIVTYAKPAPALRQQQQRKKQQQLK